MSSFVEVKDAILNKALELTENIGEDDDSHEKVLQSQAVANLVGAAHQAQAGGSADTWSKSQREEA